MEECHHLLCVAQSLWQCVVELGESWIHSSLEDMDNGHRNLRQVGFVCFKARAAAERAIDMVYGRL